MSKVTPISLELFKNRFASIAEEMGVTLMRTAFSPNIKERRDFSCALFDARGQALAQAEHIPVHLGSMPLSVASVVKALDLGPGDMAVVNDPFKGGTHLPDITVVAPVFAAGDQSGKPAFFVANRAHHADVGGMSPGSMPLSTSIFQEGLIIPPVMLVRGGEIIPETMSLLLANVRTPVEREGDFGAQIMANLTGAARLAELCAAHGPTCVADHAGALLDYAERLMRKSIQDMPDGSYAFTDYLDDDGFDATDIALSATVTIKGDAATVDFRDCAPQVAGSLNATAAITASAVLYVFRCLGPAGLPTNAGCLRPIRILTTPGTVADALPPAAVAGGNVETSQRLVDVLFGALAKALPGRIPAASQGTMNNLTIGGVDPRTGSPFAYYETSGGGMGAGPGGPGESAVHSHMTNTLNTPAEAIEYAYALRITRQMVRRGSGGRGRFFGGDGLEREIEVLADCEATLLTERRARGPYGLAGGEPGEPGLNLVLADGEETSVGGKWRGRLPAGSRLRICTPGGGGFGKA